MSQHENSSVCAVCGKTGDDDLVLLCDSPGCTHEIHMFCLSPPLYQIPEGDWYCPCCEAQGATSILVDFLDEREAAFKSATHDNGNNSTRLHRVQDQESYRFWLQMQQERYYPLKSWHPNMNQDLVACEFDPFDEGLIGRSVFLYFNSISTSEELQASGRIIARYIYLFPFPTKSTLFFFIFNYSPPNCPFFFSLSSHYHHPIPPPHTQHPLPCILLVSYTVYCTHCMHALCSSQGARPMLWVVVSTWCSSSRAPTAAISRWSGGCAWRSWPARWAAT